MIFTAPCTCAKKLTSAYRNFQNSSKMSQQADATNKKLKWEKPFPVNGQGVLIFNIKYSNPFTIVVKTKKGDKKWIALEVQETSASFKICSDDEDRRGLVTTLAKQSNSDDKNYGYESAKKISYWLSYDRDNLVLKYGKGYRMEETTLMKHDFLEGVSPENQEKERKKYYHYFNPEVKKICQLYEKIIGEIDETDSYIDTEEEVEFDPNPLIRNRPFLVKDSSESNLFLLDKGDYTLSASLPTACRVLYENIKKCELNWPEEVDSIRLSDAIRHSIEKGILRTKLDEKAKKSSKKQTYLRVTLGNTLGKSPGIPYVLEIWPSGHFSPIHNHGNANAVIKVLFGTINVQIYNKQVTNNVDNRILKFDAKAGDITWLDRNWYQTHKLENKSEDFCATVQCYNYATADRTHWPYFDYVSDTNTINEFLPNSDFTFREMRERVMEEYRQHIES